jgi:hypothetical protein
MDDLVTSLRKSELLKMILDNDYKGRVAYRQRSKISPQNKTVYHGIKGLQCLSLSFFYLTTFKQNDHLLK